MNQILLIAFGEELEKAWNLINKKDSLIKHIVSLPTGDLDSIVARNDIRCPVSSFETLPEIVSKEYYDYFIVSDIAKTSGKKGRIVEELERLGCQSDAIIDLSDVYTIESFPLYNILKHHEQHPDEYSFFITGVSHAYAGTDMTSYAKPGLNLAHTSQDLFLDYELAKLVMKSMRGKKAVIEVSPFSLHYDLSKSVNRHRILMYYPIIHKLHNYHIGSDKLHELLSKEYFELFSSTDGNQLTFPQRLGCNSLDKNLTVDDFIEMRKELAFWDNKNYRETAKENISILQAYIEDCLRFDITPILTIYPVSEWYNKYFSAVKFDELRTKLHELAQNYRISLYDFSSDERFNMSDFFDAEHLNVQGAKKISSILSSILFIP